MSDWTLFGVVEDVFEISGRGVVIVPGIPAEAAAGVSIHIGDRLLLRRTDGTETETSRAGIELVARRTVPTTPQPMPIALGPGVTKDMALPGTQVYFIGPQLTPSK